MEDWLNDTLELVNKSVGEVALIEYQNLVYIFYDHLSNRNLATMIAKLYGINENDVYFEIDKIISQKLYDINIVENFVEKLNANGFQEWIDADY